MLHWQEGQRWLQGACICLLSFLAFASYNQVFSLAQAHAKCVHKTCRPDQQLLVLLLHIAGHEHAVIGWAVCRTGWHALMARSV